GSRRSFKQMGKLFNRHSYPKSPSHTCPAKSDTYPKGAEQGTWKAPSDTLRPFDPSTLRPFDPSTLRQAQRGAAQGPQAQGGTYPKGAELGTWKATSDTYPAPQGTSTWLADWARKQVLGWLITPNGKSKADRHACLTFSV
ncbi:MAG: hypothetical protein ACPGWR_34180, partial [Ardenticatenaceae bacterium]